jgi:hypothetical protein
MMGHGDELAELGAALLAALSSEEPDAPVWALHGDELLIEGWVRLSPEALVALDVLDRRRR